MKLPSYRKRSGAQLRRALRWAQRKLHVENWTFKLCLDDQSRKHRLLKVHGSERGAVAINISELDAVVGVHQGACRKEGTDPLWTLFHEVTHVALWPQFCADPEEHYDELWNQASNRIADLLCQLWKLEGKE